MADTHVRTRRGGWRLKRRADTAGSSRLISHHAIVGIGRGEAELDYIITDGSSPNVRWKGSNTLWSLGYGAAIELCNGCRWFANTS